MLFLFFLLEELNEKIQKCQDKLDSIEEKVTKQHKKIMAGFKCIEKSIKLLAGAIVSLGDDVGTATGQISTDPWAFD